jgi:enhancing lycopene biosynthesis protein 2
MDGSEIHEATLTLYFLDKAGAEIVCLAPNKEQSDVVDHKTNQPASKERRNVLVESARIARGNVRDVAGARADELDGVILPGGYGAAKNLCTFVKDGADCKVDPGVEKLLRDLHRQKKPIGALCIAPALLAKLFGGDHKVEVTIGTDAGTASAISAMGAKHANRKVDEIAVDERNRVVTTPCYMLAQGPAQVGAGAEKVVAKVLEWA